MALPAVTKENYFSTAIQMAYMSASQFKALERCEAAAMARLRVEFPDQETLAMQV